MGILTGNRPGMVDAVNKQMVEELYDFWQARQRDFDTRVIIVTGAGEKGFCSGLDILVEFEEEKSLLDIVGLRLEPEELPGREVDVLTYDSLNPLMRDRILAEQETVL